jgi:ABC-type Fe3+-hydroxamate transport system substrate-binding protein
VSAAGPRCPRVVSLVPSLTESLTDWGVPPIACTRFCERPDLPHVGGTKDPDLDAIVALAPDAVVLCEEENLLAHHDELVARGVRCLSVRIDGVADVEPQLAALATGLGIDRPPIVVPDPPEPFGVRAFVPVWRRPWMSMSGGTYGSSLLAHLGVANLYADAAVRYPEVTVEDVAARRPDVVLLPTEPYPFKDRHRAEWEPVAPAVLVDGQDLFWWGTRTPAALERLREALARLLPGR